MPIITTSECRTELAHRASDRIEISLLWNKATDKVTIEIFDPRFGEGFTFAVAGGNALDAFHHPYAYAPTPTVRDS